MNELSPDSLRSQAHHTLDASGLFCPEPVMLLHKLVREAKAGERLLVIATDPSTERDVPKFCQFLGHALVQRLVAGDRYYYLIEKS